MKKHSIAFLFLLAVSPLIADEPAPPLLDAPGPGYRSRRDLSSITTVTDIIKLHSSSDDTGDKVLSLEAATAIAKAQIIKDGLGDKKFTVRLITPSTSSHKAFYSVTFDPRIPDPTAKTEDSYISYTIDMGGNIRKGVLQVIRGNSSESYYRALQAHAVVSEKRPPYSVQDHLLFTGQPCENPFNDPISLGLRASGASTNAESDGRR